MENIFLSDCFVVKLKKVMVMCTVKNIVFINVIRVISLFSYILLNTSVFLGKHKKSKNIC